MINDYIFDFAYGEALNDLYWRDGKNKGCKEDTVKNTDIKVEVKKYADSVILGKKNIDTYETILKIQSIEVNKSNSRLTFGNAQKLLNMTMKYLYIICCVGEGKEIYRERFRCCHVPMDSVMRDIVSTHFPDGLDKNDNLDSVSWSQLECCGNKVPEVYSNFQDAITKLIKESNTDCLPIEFDYINWKEARGKSKSEIRKIELGYKMFEEEK